MPYRENNYNVMDVSPLQMSKDNLYTEVWMENRLIIVLYMKWEGRYEFSVQP